MRLTKWLTGNWKLFDVFGTWGREELLVLKRSILRVFLSLNSENYLLARRFSSFFCSQILPLLQRKAACASSLVSEMQPGGRCQHGTNWCSLPLSEMLSCRWSCASQGEKKKSGFASTVSSVLVKSYTSKSTPISNITRLATVENTGRVEKLSKRSPPPPGDAIPVSHFTAAGARRTLLAWLAEQCDLWLLEKMVERTVAKVSWCLFLALKNAFVLQGTESFALNSKPEKYLMRLVRWLVLVCLPH